MSGAEQDAAIYLTDDDAAGAEPSSRRPESRPKAINVVAELKEKIKELQVALETATARTCVARPEAACEVSRKCETCSATF